MNKPAIVGAILLCGMGYFVASCSSSSSKNNAGSGGQPGTGGATATGGSHDAGTPDSSAPLPPQCDGTNVGPERVDGGLVQIGNTNPASSISLDVGGYYRSGDYHGYCFGYADGIANIGSTIFPPCGGNGNECFTKDSGLCVTASLGVASSSIWGAGIGCSLGEDQTGGKSPADVSLVGKTSLSVEVYGCSVPSLLRLQVNVDPPIYDAVNNVLHSGYYCADVTLSAPDSNGARQGSVALSQLQEDCWNATALYLDTSTQTAKSIQLQINADTVKRTSWDFCVSKFELD